jgi:hypothetical protein
MGRVRPPALARSVRCACPPALILGLRAQRRAASGDDLWLCMPTCAGPSRGIAVQLRVQANRLPRVSGRVRACVCARVPCHSVRVRVRSIGREPARLLPRSADAFTAQLEARPAEITALPLWERHSTHTAVT